MIPEREKVIRALTFCCYDIHDGDCNPDCPYYDACSVGSPVPAVMYDALALLKEQEPRVMTLEEIWTGEIETLWIEVEGKPHIFPGIWYRRSKKDGIPAIDITLNTGIVRGTVVSYGYAWRCWTAKPTDAQRKAVKWDE